MRIPALTIAFIVVLALTTCGGGVDPDPSCTAPTPTSSVQLADFEFTPECIGAAAGDTIELENTGATPHTFTVEGTEVDVNVEVDAGGQADLTGVAAGAYAVTCTYHPQMTGTIVVA